MSDRVESSPADSSPLTAPVALDVVIPTRTELFLGFFKVTMTGFGGVLSFARREFVLVRRWMSSDEFSDLFALCQFLPGPNIVNFGIIYGWRLYKFAGAAIALTGLLGPPVLLMILAGELYGRYGTMPVFRGGLTGLAAAATGLLIATAVQMSEPLVRRERLAQAAVALAAFVTVGIMQWSIVWVLLALAPVSIGIAWRSAAIAGRGQP